MQCTPVRIIPRLDIKGPNVVKGIRTDGLRVVGTPKDLAEKYCRQGADEILYMDIVASLYMRKLDLDLLREVASTVFIPLTVGGGIESLDDAEKILKAGADKLAINTHAIRSPSLLRDLSRHFGSQCVTLSVEAKRVSDDKWEVYTDGGRESTGRDVTEWILQAQELGAGEILLMSIDRDGTFKGYDTDLIRTISSIATVPLIVHGGCDGARSMIEAVAAGADAVSAASLFHYEKGGVEVIKNEFVKKSIHVRSA